jgi:hypothetical protein
LLCRSVELIVMTIRYSARIAWQNLTDETIIVDLNERKVFGLNSAGALVWSMVETHQIGEIVDAVSAHFFVEPKTARKDVSSFIEQMTQRGLLECAE